MSSEAKEAILDAAAEIFGHFGFKKASVEDIARRASVGKGTIYLHYESKEALFQAIVRRSLGAGFAELAAKVERQASAEGKLRVFLKGRVDAGAKISTSGFGWSQNELGAMNAMIDFADAGLPVIAEFRQKDIELVERILAEGRDAGVFRVADVRQVAGGIVEVIFSAAARIVIGKSEVRTQLEAVFDLIILGLKATP